MNRFFGLALAALTTLPGWAEEPVPSLRTVSPLAVGAAVTPEQVDRRDLHSALLERHFSVITAENAMKPEGLQPREGQFTFDQADRLADYAARTGTRLRGHTLVWHQQTPDWFFTDPKNLGQPADQATVVARLTKHIQTVVGHFRGRIDTWDVVNEALSDRGTGLRSGDEGSRWAALAGPGYIAAAFRAARAADPKAQLAINDYNLESAGGKRQAMVKLVTDLKAQGVPVDVVGLQGHISLNGPSVDEFRQAIRTFAALGVKVQVTELDVSVYAGAGEPARKVTPELLDRQARRVAALFAMFREEAAAGRLDMVVFWGVADDHTWLDDFPVRGRPDAPLLFDRNLAPKPAFWAVVDPSKFPDEPEAEAGRQAVGRRGTVLIDGEVDSTWAFAPAFETTVATLGETGAAGRFRVLWDDRNLYVLAEVTDPVLDDTSPNPYEQDSVEVFVDENNGKSAAYEPDDGQYRVSFRNGVSFNGNPAAQKAFRSAARVTEGGYRVEMAIPLTQLRPAVGTVLGFDFQVNDGTGGARTAVRNFSSGTNNGWQSPAVFGTLRLEP